MEVSFCTFSSAKYALIANIYVSFPWLKGGINALFGVVLLGGVSSICTLFQGVDCTSEL